MTYPTKKFASDPSTKSVKKSLKVMTNFDVTASISEKTFPGFDPDDGTDDNFTTFDEDDEEEQEADYYISGRHATEKHYIGRGSDPLSRGRRYIQNIQRRGSGAIAVHDCELPIVIAHSMPIGTIAENRF